MTKFTPDHLARSAFVYIRQSTPDQVLNNHESRRRQYGLAERARQLGWQDVVVIDDDLGRSGSGVTRPGFEAFWRRSARAWRRHAVRRVCTPVASCLAAHDREGDARHFIGERDDDKLEGLGLHELLRKGSHPQGSVQSARTRIWTAATTNRNEPG